MIKRVKLKSWATLEEEGFKLSWDKCYVGEKKYPDTRFSTSVHRAGLLGKSVKIHEFTWDDFVSGEMSIEVGGSHTRIPLAIIDQKIDLKKLVGKEHKYKLPRNEYGVAKYSKLNGFYFSCEFKKLKDKEARGLIKWMQKVMK